jgi:HK97 family phage portal protein
VKLLDVFKSKIAPIFATPQSYEIVSDPVSYRECKDFGPSDAASFYQFLFINGFYDLSAYAAISYFKQCSPVYTAITIISREIKAIKPAVLDKHTGQHVIDHPIFKLTACPNADVTWDEFIEQTTNYFLITGNAFMIATGAPNRPPLEIYCQPPQGVTVTYAKDGFINRYNVGIQGINLMFERREINGVFRYFTADGMKEIWHIRTFNPYTQYYTGMGMAPLAAVYFELEQHLASSVHNLSLLKRGGKLSLLLSFKQEMSDEQYVVLQEQLQNYYSSEHNAGRIMIAPHEATVQNMGMNNLDMDFLSLKKEATQAIYNALGVPLAIVSPDTMSYDNIESSQLRLYHSAVIPNAKKIYAELTNFLMHRYPDFHNVDFSFDPRDIPALELNKSEIIKRNKDLGVFTPNELRGQLGLEEINSAGANSIWIPGNVYPIGSAPQDPVNNITLAEDEAMDDEVAADLAPNEIDPDEDEQVEYRVKRREKYTRILRNKKDDRGEPLFHDHEIDALLKEYGL